MTTNYSVEYFIDKFENTKLIEWTTGAFRRRNLVGIGYCALGHCGMGISLAASTEEATSLLLLFRQYNWEVSFVNDGKPPAYTIYPYKFTFKEVTEPGYHPKENILNALYWMRDQEAAAKQEAIIDKILEEIPHQDLIKETNDKCAESTLV